MKTKLFFLFFFIVFSQIHAQKYVFGKVISDEGFEIQNVTVINLSNNEKITTNNDGGFMISGKVSDEIRFVKQGYERFSVKLSSENFKQPLKIILVKIPTPIEEVEIAYKPTGNIKEDIKHYGDTKKVAKMKGEMSKYIRQKSDPKILAAKQGEFVQPVSPGISIGKIDNKWDKTGFYDSLISTLGLPYFSEIGIKNEEIFTFLNFVLKDFDAKNILKYGFYTNPELLKIQLLIEEKLKDYRMLKKS